MPQDASTTPENEASSIRFARKSNIASSRWFTTPQPIKRLFDKFPLQTYPANELPQRTSHERDQHTLYIFATLDEAKAGIPSYNPGCLKWQAYLRFSNISFVTAPLNNHASPTGALPYLLPSASSSADSLGVTLPIPSHRIQRWVRGMRGSNLSSAGSTRDNHTAKESQNSGDDIGESGKEGFGDMRQEAYMSLLDHQIRNTYLYSLYLSPPNFASLAVPLYIKPSSTNSLVRRTLSHQLREAAVSELLKQSPTIDVENLYYGCKNAFEALSHFLGDDTYFQDGESPGLFDASVFAYTNILLSEQLDWRDTRMKEQLEGYQNLIDHRERITKQYFR